MKRETKLINLITYLRKCIVINLFKNLRTNHFDHFASSSIKSASLNCITNTMSLKSKKFFQLTRLICKECAKLSGPPRYRAPYRVPRYCGLAHGWTAPDPPRKSDLSCPILWRAWGAHRPAVPGSQTAGNSVSSGSSPDPLNIAAGICRIARKASRSDVAEKHLTICRTA